MKKIVVLTGSPRKGGNTDKMADAFIDEASKLGFETNKIETAFLNIAGCRACGCCEKSGGKCVLDDDFNAIADKLLDADGIVFASPVYWYTFSTQIKAVIDRLYSVNRTPKKLHGKKAALISACADDSADTFDGIRFSFERSLKLLGAEIAGCVLVPSVWSIGDIEKTNGIAQARTLAHKFLR